MADPLDVLTFEAGQAAINQSSDVTEHDDEIARHITAISRMLDAACGPVVIREVAAEVHDTTGPVVLRHAPVAEITTVRVASGSAITELEPVAFGGTGGGYTFDLASGILERRSGSTPVTWGGQVEVTYDAGRYESTEDVDARFADCAAAILRRLWKREAGAWSQSAQVWEGLDQQVGSGFFRVADPIIDEMLWDERIGPVIA